MAGSLGGPLELQDEGSFFVNGQLTQSTHPGTAVGGISQPGTITVNQMYVQYRIPKTVSGPAIVMVHGSGHTGATYETTPDGREGWATYFARKGFPVYVVDHSGRGRSGFNPTVINRARAEANAALLPDIQIAPRERAWYFFRIGAAYPTPFPGAPRLLSPHTDSSGTLEKIFTTSSAVTGAQLPSILTKPSIFTARARTRSMP